MVIQGEQALPKKKKKDARCANARGDIGARYKRKVMSRAMRRIRVFKKMINF
jgi:hypothetical protein